MKTTLETLIAARELISDPKRWTQGQLARNLAGNRVDPMSGNAVCYCSSGAIIKVADDDYDYIGPATKALDQLGHTDYEEFNDTHTHAEVLAVFDKTIERLKGQL